MAGCPEHAGAASSSEELRGIALGTAAQFLVSLGLCGMKWAHQRNAALPPAARSPRYVVAAFLVNAVGGLLNGVALSMASQSVIGALSTLVLVGNCVFAPPLLGEHVGAREIRGTLAIMVSTVVVVAAGSHCEVELTAPILLGYFVRPPHVAFALLTAAVVAASWSTVARAEASLQDGMRKVSEADLEAATPLTATTSVMSWEDEQMNPLAALGDAAAAAGGADAAEPELVATLSSALRVGPTTASSNASSASDHGELRLQPWTKPSSSSSGGGDGSGGGGGRDWDEMTESEATSRWNALLEMRREELYDLNSSSSSSGGSSGSSSGSGRRLALAHVMTTAAFSCYNIVFTKIIGELASHNFPAVTLYYHSYISRTHHTTRARMRDI
jgi:drug/metabolite transporter (DMT)-like permease